MLTERVIEVIPGNLKNNKKHQIRDLRVAAYCRVSTDQEEQQTSYQRQIEHYTEKIQKNQNWTMVGIFADDGISATSAEKRIEFMKLMELCKKGKVDMILTKSISRFARNTLDCLTYIRMLKEKGIAIIFEKERINTLEVASEMIISLLGSFAQAESESLSKNVTWGIRQGFKKGKVSFQYARLLGYEKGENGQPIVVKEQAEIVKKIYKNYIDGYSLVQIKKELESGKVLSPMGKTQWSQAIISGILKNEKYIGDALLQKTYVSDFLTKKVKKNNGEIPQYYVKGNHEGIISKDIWNRVQEEMARRQNKRNSSQKNIRTEHGKYSSKYALTELLICGDCGTRYRRVTWSKKGNKKVVWRCINRLEYGTKYCKDSESIEEHILQTAIMKAINIIVDDKDELLATIKNNLEIAITGKSDGVDKITIQKQIDALNSEMMALVDQSVKNNANIEDFDDKFEEISNEIKTLKATQIAQDKKEMTLGNTNSRIVEIFQILENEDLNLIEYDDILVRQLIENVIVIDKGKIRVEFKGGFQIEQMLE